jgi:hypothetical protein
MLMFLHIASHNLSTLIHKDESVTYHYVQGFTTLSSQKYSGDTCVYFRKTETEVKHSDFSLIFRNRLKSNIYDVWSGLANYRDRIT